MKILVMGAGAMGSAMGGFLSRDHEVMLIGRNPHIDIINNKGLRISGIWGDHLFNQIRGETSISPDIMSPDLVFITTKSYDTENAVKAVMPILGPDTNVISFQNGIGNEETVEKYAGKENTFGGMAIFGAMVEKPGHVKITVYASECLVGPLVGDAKRADFIANAISHAGIPTKVSDDIIRDKWMKTFYNAGLNPLSAILKVKYGILGDYEESRKIMKNIIEEAFMVAQARGIKLKVGMDEYFDYFLEKQIPPTSEHRSSMLQDIEKGKKTEIGYINGAIVNLAGENGIDVPYNQCITGIIKMMEKLSGSSNKK